MPDAPIPIQPVQNPILCSPYDEPDQHWLYDTQTGRPSKVPARREASYWFKTERTGTAERTLFLAEEERDDLPLVNALREDVRRWRTSGWRNASETTRKLLRHWWCTDRSRRLFFCQLEAVETILYLQEILTAGKQPRRRPELALHEFELLRAGRNPRPGEWVTTVAQHPKLVDFPNEPGLNPIPRYARKMASGAGKTVVMAMLIAWAFCNRGTKPGEPRYPRRVLVVCPILTIRERLRVLRPGDPGSYYERFDIVPSSMRPELAKGKVLVTNLHRFNPEVEAITVGGVQVGRLGEETPEAFARARLGGLWDDEPLMVLNDEGHHAYRPAPVREAEDALLTLAGEWKERFEQLQAAALGQERTPPVMIVVCDNTDVAMHFHRMISGEILVEAADENDEDDEDRPAGRRKRSKPTKRHGMGLPGFPDLWNDSGAEVTLRIDSKLLAAAESEDPKATRKDAAEDLRKIVSTVGTPGQPGERIRCVVSVNMLSEGWDADNVTHILGLRAFHSQLLCEQVVGRGLRRMDYVPDPETGLLTEEYVDVFGVPFSLIPFKGREPGGKAPPEDRPKHEVMALPERKALEIRFPVVEGYVASLRRHRIACDLDGVERTSLNPWSTPTAVFVRPQVGYQIGHPGAFSGFGFEEADRQQYYNSMHLLTIEFAVASEITRELTGASGNGRPGCESRQVLFPQVLGIVQEYIRERVDLNGMHPCDVGLQTYAMRWDFLVCRNPQSLARELAALIDARRSHVRNLAAKIRAEAEGEVSRLRSEGWERTDFARALRDLFDPDGQSPR